MSEVSKSVESVRFSHLVSILVNLVSIHEFSNIQKFTCSKVNRAGVGNNYNANQTTLADELSADSTNY